MSYATLTQRLGISIDQQLLETALTHTSFSYENGKTPDNERLEFLGDSVLGFLVTDHLFRANPDLDEGELSRLRNSTVSAKTLSLAATQIGLGEFLRLGKGESLSGGFSKPNILADALEAIIGAAFLSGGLESARTVVEKFILPLVDDRELLLETSEPRTVLLEISKKLGLGEPVFEVSFTGPDHDRLFFAKVIIQDKVIASGEGKSRKSAEAMAASSALNQLRS
ncbi:MAG: ribonuclease III [Microbacteriaceae bacterium]|nr:ribonuclease III [Microbacteriaceae bacterium]